MPAVLVLSYYFPPSGGSGVQRVLKFVKHLPALGWEPVVVTVDPDRGAFPKRDPSLWSDVPDSVEVHQTAALDPFGAYARLTGQDRAASVKTGTLGPADTRRERAAHWIRANVVLPDARVGWAPFAARRAGRIIRERTRSVHPIRVVLTSGPPHSTHLAGRWLQRRFNLPWVADFRDPWTDINYYGELPMTAPARALDAALERTVLAHADRIVVTAPAAARVLEEKGGRPPAAFAVVTNGFDADDFAGPAPSQPEHFETAHVGSLYGLRNPDSLWEALGRLVGEGAVPDLRVRLVGRTDAAVDAAIRERGLAPRVDRVPYLPHEEAVAAMRRAHALLLAVDRAAAEAIPGKLFEYLGAGRPVVGVGPAGGDTAAILEGSNAGAMFARDDAEGVARYVRALYTAWEAGAPVQGASPEAAAAYTRRAQTARLGEVLQNASQAAP